MRIRLVIGFFIALAAVAPSRGETPLGTAFTYQGQLKEGGAPLEGTADFQFRLWDAAGSGDPPTGGIQVGGVQAINALPVTAGLFNVTLNAGGEFGGNAFNGSARWLQVAVRSPAGGGVFTTLAPRQPMYATPYALFALSSPGSVSGSGTVNTIPLWSGGTTLGNSQITQSANGVQLPNGVQLGVGAQGNRVAFGSPNSETGMTISGAGGRADLRFDGTLKLVNGPGGIPPATNGIAINTSGNVGMGTVTPNTRLTLSGGPSWTSSFWTASMNLQNASTIGWEANASGQRFGIGQSTGGLYFFRTYAAVGQTIPPPNYDMEITDNGNVVFTGAIDIGYEIVTGDPDALCPSGKKLLGGGCYISGDAEIRKSYPLNNGWHCEAGDIGGFYGLDAYAICARVK